MQNGTIIQGEMGPVIIRVNDQTGPSLASNNSTITGSVTFASRGEYDLQAGFPGKPGFQPAQSEKAHVRVSDDCLPIPAYILVFIAMIAALAVSFAYLVKSGKRS